MKQGESDRQEDEPEIPKEGSRASLEDVAKVIRFLQCADASIEEKKKIIIHPFPL